MVRWASGVTRTRQRAVGGPPCSGAVRNATPAGADVVAEHLAQLIVLHLADIGRAGAERGQRRHAVGAGAARHLDRRPDARVEPRHARAIDQRHGALGQIEPLELPLVGLDDHVDDRVAEPDHVVAGGGAPSLIGSSSRDLHLDVGQPSIRRRNIYANRPFAVERVGAATTAGGGR